MLGYMKQKLRKQNKRKLIHGSLDIRGSPEEWGRMFQNCTHRTIFFHVTSKKNLTHALTVTSFALFWESDSLIEHFSWNSRHLECFLFFFSSFLKRTTKRDRSSSSCLIFRQMFIPCAVCLIRIHFVKPSTLKLSWGPTFSWRRLWCESFFLSYEYILWTGKAERPMQGSWSIVGWDKHWSGNQKTWALALNLSHPSFLALGKSLKCLLSLEWCVGLEDLWDLF